MSIDFARRAEVPEGVRDFRTAREASGQVAPSRPDLHRGIARDHRRGQAGQPQHFCREKGVPAAQCASAWPDSAWCGRRDIDAAHP